MLVLLHIFRKCFLLLQFLAHFIEDHQRWPLYMPIYLTSTSHEVTGYTLNVAIVYWIGAKITSRALLFLEDYNVHFSHLCHSSLLRRYICTVRRAV